VLGNGATDQLYISYYFRKHKQESQSEIGYISSKQNEICKSQWETFVWRCSSMKSQKAKEAQRLLVLYLNILNEQEYALSLLPFPDKISLGWGAPGTSGISKPTGFQS
jgi:hypothetical protein